MTSRPARIAANVSASAALSSAGVFASRVSISWIVRALVP